MLPKWATHPAGVTMATMLLFGAAFIIGHHFFYQSLSGKQPPNVVYFSAFAGGLTGQQFNLAAGSVFAFLVNSALGVVITTAANQALWVAVRTKPSKLEIIDSLTTATTNIWSLFDFRLWKKSPIRMALVTVFWLLSVTSFIAPATLNIKWGITTSVSMTRVPQVDFTSLNFANIQSLTSSSELFYYYDPQYPVLQTVAESIAGGHILPIASPHQNATWLLKFPGPALSCENLDQSSSLYNDIQNNILVTMSAGPGESQARACAYSFGYISWVPNEHSNGSDISFLPFPDMSLNTNNTPYEPPSQGVGPITASPATEPLTLFIAALPNSTTLGNMFCIVDNPTALTQLAFDMVCNMTITRCTMYNASYVANFTYIDNIQRIELTTQDSFNNITGQSSIADSGTGLLHHEKGSDGSVVYNATEVKNFAYQAIMDAFGRMFVGTIAYDFVQRKQVINTQMALTPLLNTKDFNFLQPLAEEEDLHAYVNANPALWDGLSVEQAPNSTMAVAAMMEELFRNATISLISSPLLQPNYSSPYAPPDINVTVTTYALVYSYAAQTLWLAYGIALGMTLLSILLGAISIYHNGGSSYTTKFSTILRAAYCIDFSEPIRPEDTDGQDPTPRYIKKLTISFPPVGTAVRYNKAAQSSEGEQLQQI